MTHCEFGADALDHLVVADGLGNIVVTRRFVPPVPGVMNCRAISPGDARVLSMMVSIFESCASIEVFDISHNKIEDTLEEHIELSVRALDRLAAFAPLKAELVKLRYFAGLPLDDAAQSLGISRTTADRYWAFARAWLYTELDDHPEKKSENPLHP